MVVDLPVLIRTGDLQDMEHSVIFTMTNGEQAGRQKGLVASWGVTIHISSQQVPLCYCRTI